MIILLSSAAIVLGLAILHLHHLRRNYELTQQRHNNTIKNLLAIGQNCLEAIKNLKEELENSKEWALHKFSGSDETHFARLQPWLELVPISEQEDEDEVEADEAKNDVVAESLEHLITMEDKFLDWAEEFGIAGIAQYLPKDLHQAIQHFADELGYAGIIVGGVPYKETE